MKHYRWQIILGAILLFLSAALYFLHYLIFHDAHHIFIYLLGDIAFVPVEVLLVTLVIHGLLNIREKREKLEKLNMVIETFFSEVGNRLLVVFSDIDPNLSVIKKKLIIKTDWNEKDFINIHKWMKQYNYRIKIDELELNDLKEFLLEKRQFLLRLLENPVLLEHQPFTDLLMATFHLTEELANRTNYQNLTNQDTDHLKIDIERVYSRLVDRWIDYMKYLKNNYPYLFSLAMRTNPFDENASVMLK